MSPSSTSASPTAPARRSTPSMTHRRPTWTVPHSRIVTQVLALEVHQVNPLSFPLRFSTQSLPTTPPPGLKAHTLRRARGLSSGSLGLRGGRQRPQRLRPVLFPQASGRPAQK
eukprot:6189278-Pleurochrysis_carterae.AAC.2